MTAFNLEQEFRAGLAKVEKYAISGNGTTYYSLLPGYNTVIQLNKGGSVGVINLTSDYTAGDDVDNAVFSTLNATESTTDYHQGHNAGLTGFKLVISSYSSAGTLRILQYKAR